MIYCSVLFTPLVHSTNDLIKWHVHRPLIANSSTTFSCNWQVHLFWNVSVDFRISIYWLVHLFWNVIFFSCYLCNIFMFGTFYIINELHNGYHFLSGTFWIFVVTNCLKPYSTLITTFYNVINLKWTGALFIL